MTASNIHNSLKALTEAKINNYPNLVKNLLKDSDKVGTFSSKSWSPEKMRVNDKYLQSISELPFSEEILAEINNQTVQKTNEIIEYLILELEWNIFDDLESSIKELKRLINKYPNNLYFHSSFSSLAVDDRSTDIDLIENSFIKSLKYLELMPKDDMPGIMSSTRTGINLCYRHMEVHNYQKAQNIYDEIRKIEQYKKPECWIMFESLSNAILHSQSLHQYTKNTEKKINKTLEEQYKDNIKKGFEQLIIFTAIITFVITAAGSAIRSPLPLWEIVALGMTLLVFVLSIMMCLEKPKNFLKDFRFYVLISAFALVALLAGASVIEKVTINNNYTSPPARVAIPADSSSKKANESN